MLKDTIVQEEFLVQITMQALILAIIKEMLHLLNMLQVVLLETMLILKFNIVII